MKKCFCIVLLTTSYFVGISQDSTFLPKPSHRGKYVAHTYYTLKDVPKSILQAIDSINGSHVKFYEKNEKVNRTDISSNAKREFRALAEEPDHLLMTYAIWLIKAYREKRNVTFGLYACPKINKVEADELIQWWKIQAK